MASSRRHAWYRRRPCFWLALAAAAGILAAVSFSLPPWAWLAAALVGAAVPARDRVLLPLPLAMALCGGLAAAGARAPAAPDAGSPIVARGVLAEVGPPGEHSRRAILAARWRLAPGGWTPYRERLGIRAPLEAREGDLVEVSGVGRAPLPPTNPGGYDARTAWLRRGVRLLVRLRPAGYLVLGRRRPAPWREWSAGLRERVFALHRRTLSPEAALIADEFLLGDPEPDDPETAEEVTTAFRDAGLIHLLVVSGSQVSLVLGMFVWLGWRWWGARRLCWALGAAAVGAYYLLTGGDASVARAALAGAVLAGGLLLSRECDPENSLGLAALVLLLVNPFVLFDAGARLSFAAVWALLRFAPPLAAALGPPAPGPGRRSHFLTEAHRRAAGAAAVVVAAHLGTAPLVALHLQRAGWWGFLANLVAAVLVGWLLLLTVLHLGLAGLGCFLLAPVVRTWAESLLGWARFFARPPLGAVDVFPIPEWAVLLFLAALALPAAARWGRGRTLALTAVLAGGLAAAVTWPAPPPRDPTLRALDVGQGDALLLQAPDGTNALVDAGPPGPPGAGALPLVRALRALRVARLDAVFVTHAHLDHIGGLPAVLRALPVRRVVHNVARLEAREAAAWKECLAAAAARGVPLERAEAGSRLRIGASSFEVAGPVPVSGPPPDDLNETSLVLRWEYGAAAFLLMGDAGFPAEAALLARGADLRAAVLKAGHHGSRTATGDPWLRAVRPTCVVLSCGRDNRYGHPASETLARLAAFGAHAARTDRSGMLTVRVRNGRVYAASYLRSPP